MKVCPQCNSVYSDDIAYCSNDGGVLVEENLPLPTEIADAEAETVIRRREPVTIEIDDQSPAKPVGINYAASSSRQTPVVVEKTSGSKFYALFLLVGLLLGGSLVLATLLAAKYINFTNEKNISVQTKTGENKTRKPTENTDKERDTEIYKSADEFHQRRNADKPDEDFNGRVIVQNANVRSAPSLNAPEVDILPDGDRLTIESRENSDSPWYYVTCEHGTGGWMHGNTIEFTDGNF